MYVYSYCVVGITCFLFFFFFFLTYVQGFSKLTNMMSGRVRTRNSILEIPNTNKCTIPYIFEKKKNIPQDFTLPLKDQQASIYLMAVVLGAVDQQRLN